VSQSYGRVNYRCLVKNADGVTDVRLRVATVGSPRFRSARSLHGCDGSASATSEPRFAHVQSGRFATHPSDRHGMERLVSGSIVPDIVVDNGLLRSAGTTPDVSGDRVGAADQTSVLRLRPSANDGTRAFFAPF
jgi:hypothetical protein